MTLPFKPQDYAEYIENKVPDAQALSDYTPRTIADEIVFSSEPQLLQLSLTATQYRQIVSSLFTGAWYCYPDNWLEVMASFWQGIKVLDCNFIADCIANSESVQSALFNLLNSSGFGINAGLDTEPPQMLPTSQSGENLLPSGYSCDYNHLFGMSRFIVQQLNAGAQQLLENIELITNPVELAAVFIDNAEVTAYVGSSLELVTWIQGQLIEYYNGSYDQNTEDELACAVFCEIKDTCELTLDSVIAAYATKTFGLPSDTESITSILDWLVNTTMNISVATVATYHYFALQALRAGSNALGLFGLRAFKLLVEQGAEQTDSTWETLCEDCPPDGTLYDVLATGNPFTGVGLTSIDVNAGQTVTVTYVGDLWDYIQSPPRYDGNGAIGNPAPSGSIRVGSPLCQLAYSPRPDNLNWLAGNNGFSYTFVSSGQLLLAMVDGNSSSYTNNVGSIKVLVNITG